VTPEHVYITETYHIITYFSLGYPRDSGTRYTWRAGSMRYAHCYDIAVSLNAEHLIVNCMKQEFQMDDLFDTPEMVENSEDKAPNGWWGESFTYNQFSLPRKPVYQYIQETETFHLKVVE
jgi:hypothetical protein